MGSAVATKQRWKIIRTSCRCGGNWAWYRQRPSGAWESQGCVCHHPWTLAMRLAVKNIDPAQHDINQATTTT